jgi:hypothetical protein
MLARGGSLLLFLINSVMAAKDNFPPVLQKTLGSGAQFTRGWRTEVRIAYLPPCGLYSNGRFVSFAGPGLGSIVNFRRDCTGSFCAVLRSRTNDSEDLGVACIRLLLLG